jgi:hypothetical protein
VLIHPIAVGALVLLVVNDHLLKTLIPGVITGKLSDVAGMVLAPLVLATAVTALAPLRLRQAPGWGAFVTYGAVLVVAVVFGLTKTWPPATELYASGVATVRAPLRWLLAAALGLPPWTERIPVVRDPTDLVAIPLGVLGVWAVRRYPARQSGTMPLG